VVLNKNSEFEPTLVLRVIYNGLFSREHSKDLNKSMRDLQRLSPDGRVKPEAYAGRKMLGLTALYR
jgi:hypothetical protein